MLTRTDTRLVFQRRHWPISGHAFLVLTMSPFFPQSPPHPSVHHEVTCPPCTVYKWPLSSVHPLSQQPPRLTVCLLYYSLLNPNKIVLDFLQSLFLTSFINGTKNPKEEAPPFKNGHFQIISLGVLWFMLSPKCLLCFLKLEMESRAKGSMTRCGAGVSGPYWWTEGLGCTLAVRGMENILGLHSSLPS